VSFSKWKCGHCRFVWKLPDHAPPNSSNQSGTRLRTPALCQRPQQKGTCAPSPPAAKGLWRHPMRRTTKAGKLMLLVAPDRERWADHDSPVMSIGLSSDCRATAAVLKGFGRRPLARRLGEPPGAGVRKPRKEETAGRKGAVWWGAAYGDF
jgi:hypothetical protein